MTVQVQSTKAGQSKKTLLAYLQEDPARVGLYDPSVFPGSRGNFRASDIRPGERIPVVMDHPKRSRFALIIRKADGSWRVE